MAKKRKQDAKVVMLPHSEAKLQMYSNYLERYVKILSRNPYIKFINIFDVFCGTGIYENGKEGSPIRAYHIILEDIKTLEREGKEVKTIRFIINDKLEENVENVKQHIGSLEKHPKLIVKYGNEDVVDLFPRAIQWLKKQKESKNLLFIDPYGYKMIQKNDLEGLMSNKNTEIVLFLPIANMTRFTVKSQKDDAKAYQPLRNFINQFFDENHAIRNSNSNHIEYIAYIKEALSIDGKYYSTSYYIQRDNTNYYALFFITPNIYGLEKILETKWSLDKQEGEGFLQNPLLLGTKDVELEKKLKQFISITEKNNVDLYEFVLKSGYLPKHVGGLLKKWETEGILEITDKDGKPVKSRSKNYYMTYDLHKEKEVKLKIKLKLNK